MALSPVMLQYLEKKRENEDAILFFRLGDFYEMFFDDALIVSRELDLVLTGKQCGEAERAPMCGVPYHSADMYIGKLVEKGYKVVVCEQMEDASQAKGLVARDVVRVITPGTVTDANQLNDGKNNFIASIYKGESLLSICFADISTGEVIASDLPSDFSRLSNELCTYSPREVITNIDLSVKNELSDIIKERLGAYVGRGAESESFNYETASAALSARYKVDIASLGLSFSSIIATGALVAYLEKTQKTDISQLKKPKIYFCGEYMEIDKNTRRNLEISETMRKGEKKGSLLWALDMTKTAMGARMFRRWLDLPLTNANAIYKRLDAVEELTREFVIREELTEALAPILDIERTMTRIVYKTGNGKDMRSAAATMGALPQIKRLLSTFKSEALVTLYEKLDTLDDLFALVDGTVVEDPPFSVREGGFIKEGVNSELDRLRHIMKNSKGMLADIEAREKDRTGIRNMKIGYNKVFGYYIEVSKGSVADVPEDYIRKQTLTTGERYITPELKELEGTIFTASDRINSIEFEIFSRLCDRLSENIGRIQTAAEIIATVDVYLSLATAAVKNGYSRPEVDIGTVIEIKDGRHPVVEKFCGETGFVPNDTYLDTENNKLMLITGPNMAGKSTYMRQVAIITLMAQMGSFVPAREARIGVVDRLFTRVGASDDLAAGESTFMLEMTEVAYILRNATSRSLIIYDEVGRGTSTFDGMSIARAVAEYTAGKKLGARTLFATHYHELCDLEGEGKGIVNYCITARKRDKGIVFLRKIVRGSVDESYGIEVAQLANVPREVIKRAREVLSALTSEKTGNASSKRNELDKTAPQSFSIDDYIGSEIIEKLRMTDADTLTPLDALRLVYELKKMLQ